MRERDLERSDEDSEHERGNVEMTRRRDSKRNGRQIQIECKKLKGEEGKDFERVKESGTEIRCRIANDVR